eukprot:GSChrysophyteH1.ASY1.ANO1.2765.1 assembled CDS
MGPKTKKAQSKELLRKKQETGWSVQLQGSSMPEYKAELDPYCPRAQVRKYNQDRKIKAEQQGMKTEKARDWIEKKLTNTFEEVPLKFNPTLRAKAASAAGHTAVAGSRGGGKGAVENLAEIEVLQKVIVRENLLAELKRLLESQNEVLGCLGEVVELVKAIRYQTVEIVEDISSWQLSQVTRRAFLYRGVNYLVKIFEDLAFLDQWEDIISRFCFEFTGNPLAYRGGGDIATGPGGSVKNESVQRLTEFYNQDQGNFDGIEVVRLRNCEKIIQMEFDRLDAEKEMFAKQNLVAQETLRRAGLSDSDLQLPGSGSVALGELGMESTLDGGNSAIVMSQQEMALASHQIQQRELNSGSGRKTEDSAKIPASDSRKWRQKFNPRKVKQERAATLTAEADELRAMETHLEDKISTMVDKHKEIAEKRNLAEKRRREAQSLSRDAAAHHLTVEISLHSADMQDINAHVKDLQRQIYFIAIERNRKRKVVKKLREEIEQDKKRADLEKKLGQKVKEGGLLNALKALNQIQSKEMEKAVGYAHVDGSPKRTAKHDESASLVEFIEDFQQQAIQEASQVKFDDSMQQSQIRADGMTVSQEGERGPIDARAISELASAALAGGRAGRSAGDDDWDAAGNDVDVLPAGSAAQVAKARRAAASQDDPDLSAEEMRIMHRELLDDAKEKYFYARFSDVKNTLHDILSPLDDKLVGAADAVTILEARLLLAETNRAVAKYEDALSLYQRCQNDLEDAKFFEGKCSHGYKNTLLLAVVTGMADLYRNTCLYEDCRNALYKASKLSEGTTSLLLPTTADEGSHEANLAILAKAEYQTSQGAFHEHLGEYAAAASYYHNALDDRRTVLGLDDAKVASSLAHLGRLHMHMGDYKKAARLIGESLVMRESIFAADAHPAVGSSMYLKAVLLQQLGQYKEAGSLMSKSLAIRRACLPNKHPSIAESLHGSGELTRHLGYPSQATESLDEAFRMRIRRFPEGSKYQHHISVIQSMVSMGCTSRDRGIYQESYGLFKGALDKFSQLVPKRLVEEHAFEQRLQLLLAEVLLHLGDYDLALKYATGCCQVLTALLGSEHPLVSDSLCLSGRIYTSTGQYFQSHFSLCRSRAMYVHSYGDEHPLCAVVSLYQAQNFHSPGYYQEAVEAEALSIKLRLRSFESSSPFAADSFLVRAKILRELRDYEQARTLFEQVLQIYLNSYGENSAHYAEALAEYGDCLRQMGLLHDAEEVIVKAIVYLKEAFRSLNADDEWNSGAQTSIVHVKVALCMRSYGQLYLDTNRVNDALDKLENDVYPALVKLLPKNHPDVEFTKGLVALCISRKLHPRATNKFGFPATPREAQLMIIDQLEMQGGHVNNAKLIEAYNALASLHDRVGDSEAADQARLNASLLSKGTDEERQQFYIDKMEECEDIDLEALSKAYFKLADLQNKEGKRQQAEESLNNAKTLQEMYVKSGQKKRETPRLDSAREEAQTELSYAPTVVARPRTSELTSHINNDNAQDEIAGVLEFLETYEKQRCPFNDDHPWVDELGGYPAERSEERLSRLSKTKKSFANARDEANREVAEAAAAAAQAAKDSVRVGFDDNESAAEDGSLVQGDNVSFEEMESKMDGDRASPGLGQDSVVSLASGFTAESPGAPAPFKKGGFDGPGAKTVKDLKKGLELGISKKEDGYFDLAKDILEDVLKARRRLELKNNATVLMSRIVLADIYRGMADYKQSDDLYNKSLSSIEGSNPADIPEKDTLEIQVYVGLSDQNRNLCKYSKAISFLDKARDARALIESDSKNDKLLRKDHWKLLVSDLQCCEGSLKYAMGDLNSAQDLYHAALTTRRTLLGGEDPKVAACLSHLGRIALSRDDYKLATRLISEALRIREEQMQKNHPALGASYYQKGLLCQRLGHYKRAGTAFQTSLEIRIACLPQKHPAIAESLLGIADLIRTVGYPKQAQNRYDEALALTQEVFRDIPMSGSNVWHKKVAECMAGLAANAEDRGQYKAAADIWESVAFNRHMLLKPCGAEHYCEVAYAQLRVAKMNILLNKLSEARGLIDKAGRTIFSWMGGDYRPSQKQPMMRLCSHSALCYYTLGLLSNVQGNFCDAQDCYDKALRIWHGIMAYTIPSSYNFETVAKDRSIRPEPSSDPVGSLNGTNQEIDFSNVSSSAKAVDVAQIFRGNLDNIPLDKKLADQLLPEYIALLEARCLNMGLSGPGYINDAMDMCNRAYNLRVKMYCNDFYDSDTGQFNFSSRGKSPERGESAKGLALQVSLKSSIMGDTGDMKEIIASYKKILGTLNTAFDGDEQNCLHAAILGQYGEALLRQCVFNKAYQMDTQENIAEGIKFADEILSKALVLRRRNYGDRHPLVADSMQQISFLLSNKSQLDQSLALMKDGALPLAEEALGYEHPYTLFISGCVGLCMLKSKSSKPDAQVGWANGTPTLPRSVPQSDEERSGRDLLVASLNYFRNYKQGAFTKESYYVNVLGTYQRLINILTKSDGDENDHEAEEVRYEIDRIPTKPSIGLIYNPSETGLREIVAAWKEGAAAAAALYYEHMHSLRVIEEDAY